MGLPKETLSFDELCDMAEVVSGIMDISVLQHVLLAEAKKGNEVWRLEQIKIYFNFIKKLNSL